MKKVFVILIMFIVTLQHAQELVNRVVPPSPTASSLAQFADVPVSYYTGLPNIGVPIYTINSGVLSVPIGLQYHGGGIKVGQEASWVGLGWSLSVGGSISRVIKGNDDLIYHPELSGKRTFLNSSDIPESSASSSTWLEYYTKLVYDGHDPEPDIFYYNFGNFSGKFVIEKSDENEIIGLPLEAEAIRIRYLIEEALWIITDPKGISYYFSVPETTRTYSYSSDTETLSDVLNPDTDLRTNGGTADMITTWYLDTIESSNGAQTITFEYEEDEHATQSQIRVSQSASKFYDFNVICSTGNSVVNTEVPRINTGTVDVTKDVHLSRINFDNGYVIFNTSDRIDMESSSNSVANPQKLDDISVYSNANTEPIVFADFTYDYFQKQVADTEISKYYRLKLDSFSMNGQNYDFSYNDPGINIPSKTTLSVDHWGYFNNANNSNLKRWGDVSNSSLKPGSLIPGIYWEYVDSNYEVQSAYLEGADRDPYEEFTKYFVLEEVTLPTGGRQIFEWESNQYQGNKVIDDGNRAGLLGPGCEGYAPGSPDTPEIIHCESNEFEIVDDNVKVTLNYFVQKIETDPQAAMRGSYIGYYKWENGVWEQYGQGPTLTADDYYQEGSRILYLTPGRYKMFIHYPHEYLRVQTWWSYQEEPITANLPIDAAGLRISNITMEDGNTSMIKKIEYHTENEEVSSGVLMADPIYHYNQSISNIKIAAAAGGTVLNCVSNQSYLIGSSSTIIPLSITGNNYIGYSRVSIGYEENQYQGETIHEFYNFKPVTNYSNAIPNFPVQSDTRNGKLRLITVKNANNITVEKKAYYYLVNASIMKNTQGMFIHRSPIAVTSSSSTFLPVGMTFNPYDNYSNWCYLSGESTTRYDINGENPITQNTDYYYDNSDHLQVTRTETTDSNAKKMTTKMYYPDDITGASSLDEGGNFTSNEYAQIRKLQQDGLHRISTLVQTVTKIDDEIIEVKRNQFSEFENFVLPSQIQTAKNTQSLENRVTYHSYNENGKPLEISEESGPHTSYIWGYNQQFPIAKIENASYDQIALALGISMASLKSYSDSNLSSINDLRNNSNMSETMITTYTYDPLVGISSITNPNGYTIYYEYDDFNRLEFVRDQEGNLISENRYNYKN
ncbi:hypothetical protein [Aquimarina pacifica]|uniref:hypothetical protein n=1 Tax=Aquimarina pacifica TaxID=1296415 RepID=UPI001267E5C6|nr:hypothetical protein [Aquimarina pacifica]